MKVREVTNYMIRKKSGDELWDYMFNGTPFSQKTTDLEQDSPSYQIIDEILDVGEKYVELHDLGVGFFFTNKARLLKPNEWYWAHPGFASRSSKGLVPNAYSVSQSDSPWTISRGLKKYFGIEDRHQILEIRMGLMEMYDNKKEWDIVRRTNPLTSDK